MKSHASEPYCLVLGGGGAKGVYHAGVWKALKELDIHVDAFVGNSVGALMAALLAQGDEKALRELVDTIEIHSILKVPSELVQDGRLRLGRAKFPFFRVFTRDVLEHRGIDTTPLRRLLNTYIDEEKLRQSGNDFGMQAFNLSDMRPGGKFIDEIEPGNLIEYLLASSAVPGFVAPIIKGKKYVDGGVYDNVPYSMARKRGYRRIIAVDVVGAGVTRRPDIQGSETVYIKCSVSMGGILDFNRNTLDDLIGLGYLDTMRVFGNLRGYRYFLEPNKKSEDSFSSFLETQKGKRETALFLTAHGHTRNTGAPLELRQMFPREMRFDKNLLLALLDCAAHFLEIPIIRSYTYEEITAAISKKRREIDEEIQKALGSPVDSRTVRMSKGIESIVKSALKKDELENPPYYYFKILDYTLRDKAKAMLRARVSGFFPNAQAAEFLLGVIDYLG